MITAESFQAGIMVLLAVKCLDHRQRATSSSFTSYTHTPIYMVQLSETLSRLHVMVKITYVAALTNVAQLSETLSLSQDVCCSS